MTEAIESYIRKIPKFESMTFEERREAVKSFPLLSEKVHNKTTLKELFRVKPAQGEKSSYSYKGKYGTIDCWRLDQCVPMKALSSKPRTERQVQATERLVHLQKVESKENQAALLARNFVENDVVILDTETTSLSGVVIQIALVSSKTGNVLYESLVHTLEPIEEAAFNVHGITKEMLESAPLFSEVAKDIALIMKDKHWTAYNVSFDQSILENSIIDDKADAHYDWIKSPLRCVMYDIAVPVCGGNRHGRIKLIDALYYFGLSLNGEAHDATVDSIGTVKLIQHIADLAVD